MTKEYDDKFITQLTSRLLKLSPNSISNAIDYYHEIENIESEFRRAKLLIQSAIHFKGITPGKNLTRAEVSRLNGLNDKCYIIQDELVNTYYESKKEAHTWMSKKTLSGKKDAEIEIVISCYIGENDEKWKEDSDNLIAQFNDTITAKSVAELNGFTEYGLNLKRPHSYLFHSLYDHSVPQLSWHDLLRIDTICVEVTTIKQLDYSRKKTK